MTNNLRVLKKDLKSFAKRVKDFKYTESALITFLLTGLIELTGTSFNLFSAENEIQEQTKAINTSITNLKSDFRFARHENDKLLRKTNLELVKLMEQGDHVVKSPWSSWQYGINGFYNSWQGSYKGRGDKTADYKYERDKTMSKTKYEAYPHTLYGNTTELGLKQEPNASIPVSASLTPLIPRVKQANVSMAVDISELPSFTPRTVTPPTAPTISPMKGINTPSFSMKSSSLSNWGESHFDDANTAYNGVIESVAILGGDFNVERLNPDPASKWKYSYTNYKVKNAFNTGNMTSDYTITGITNTLAPNSEITVPSRSVLASNSKSGFLRMTNDSPVSQGSTLLNQATFKYTNSSGGDYVRELAHLDMHGSNPFSTERGKLSAIAGLKASVLPNFDDVMRIAQNTTGSTKSQTFINAGKITIEGDQASFTNSYDHDGDKSRVASVINTGDGEISVSPSNPNNKGSAVFIVSPEIYKEGNPQIFYNAGKINLYSKKSAIFFLNPNGDVRWNHDGSFHERNYESPDNDQDNPREITIVNRTEGNNKMISYGDGDVGIYLKTSKYIKTTNLDFRTQNLTDYVTKNGTWAPMVMYGDNNIGLYAPKDTESQLFVGDPGPIIGNFAVSIGDSNGNYFLSNNDDTYIDSSYGIFSSVNIDLSNDVKDIKSGHQITINKNSKNGIGVLTSNNAKIKLGAGKIELNGGFDNTGIVIGGSKKPSGDVKDTDGSVIGDVISINGISNADGGNRAIYAWDGNNRGNSVEVNAIKSENTINSIAIVAEKNAKITVNGTASSNPSIIGTTDGTGFEYGVKINDSKYVYDPNRVVSATDATSTDNVGAAYANDEAVITINRTALPSVADGPNISIEGGIDTYAKKIIGFGLFADNKAKINAQNNWIKVTNGATNIASLGTAEIDLKGATVEYKGEGYALYTNTTSKYSGAINMSDAKLVLDGKAVGYVYYQDQSNMITVNHNTSIDILDDDVIVADLRKTSGQVTVNVENKATPDRLRDQLIGGVGSVGSSNGKTRYKYAVVDNAQINIKSAVDKASSITDSDSEVFAKRFLYQNSKIDVTAAGSVKAELDDTQMKAIDVNLKTPVGLAVTASAQTKDNDTTGINNSGTVSADRTVGSDRGGIGLYVDYGYINNNAAGTVNVEKGTVNNPNDKAIGIFGTNSTKIVNDGKVNAGGKKSIGILGLSYRIDSKTGLAIDPKTETYYDNVTTHSGHHPFGVVDVENGATGKITMDNDGAVGMFVKNNSTDKDSSGNDVVTNASDIKTKNETRGVNKGEITINGNDSSVGMGANNGIITNASSGKINVNGTKSAGMYGTNDSELVNAGEINVAATSAGNESIGMYIDDQVSTIANTGKINVGKSSYGIYGKDVNMTAGEINVADDGVGVYSTGPSVNLSGGKIDVANKTLLGYILQMTARIRKRQQLHHLLT